MGPGQETDRAKCQCDRTKDRRCDQNDRQVRASNCCLTRVNDLSARVNDLFARENAQKCAIKCRFPRVAVSVRASK